jgi:Na+(H+)/acetate symporter ActP
MFKVPMQFIILFSGAMVFVFYLFTQPPLFFNTPVIDQVKTTAHAGEWTALERKYAGAFERQRGAALDYIAALDAEQNIEAKREGLRQAARETAQVRDDAKHLVAKAVPSAELKDTDYVFLGFVVKYIPKGIVGLLVAVILCAAMSSIASELTALGSTTMLDFYQRMRRTPVSEDRALFLSKLFTALWGVLAVAFAGFAALIDNLIEAVNILGSLFYGTMLGLFLVGFFVRRIGSTATLIGAILAEALVLGLFFASDLGFLWYNVVGAVAVVVFGALLQPIVGTPRATPA